jgi:hypothetical protein
MANQITVYLDPAQMPARTQDQQTFDTLWASLIANLPTFGAQFNAAVAAFNVVAAGGAYAIPYTVDLSATADADPTPGKLRFNAANQNAATQLFADLLGADTVDYTTILDQLDASTSQVKGQLRIVKQGDPTKFLTFDLTARATATGYRKLVVTNTGGSSANPFGANEAVLIKFTRTGDAGSSWDPPVMYVRTEQPLGTNGGALVAGSWVIRTLNTVKRNTISSASLGSGMVTLPAGTYEIEASAPGYQCGSHQIRLYNVTDSAVVDAGTSEYSPNVTNAFQTRSVVRAYLTISAAKTIRLEHWAGASGSSGSAGINAGASAGTVEVYSEMKITKRA